LGFAQAAFRFLVGTPADESTTAPIFWVLPGVLAGRPGPAKVPWTPAKLAQIGIGGIVSLDGPIRTREIVAAGIKHLPVYQPMVLLTNREEMVRFLTVMKPVIHFIDAVRREERSVLVHCYHGCDRTGAILACYLVAREGMSAEEAADVIQKANPDALWAMGYLEVIETFESLFAENPQLFETVRAE
jgi:predicted protein tyrosine phosphatase